MAQQCPGRKGFSPDALMSCFLSSPKWCPILRNSPASVLVVWTYSRAWQIHSASFGNFLGTEVNQSEPDRTLMEPGWQLDASPSSQILLLRDSSLGSAAPQEQWLGRTWTPTVSKPGMIWNESFGAMIKRGFFAVSLSKILPKLAKGLYLLIKGSFGIPSLWDSMQREFSESSLKINNIRGEKAQR